MGNRIKPIPSLPGYFAGEDGTIYSAWEGVGWNSRIGGKLKPRKATTTPDGRSQVNPNRKVKRVSRLVLEAFVGTCPPRIEAGNFPYSNPTNNSQENQRL